MPDLTAVEAEMCRRSLRRFLEAAWPTLEPGTPFVPGWHIDALCDHLQAVTEGRIRNLLVNMPPRHSKSTVVSVAWPAWAWTRVPEQKWLCGSYSQRLSTRDSVACRRLIESPWYRTLFGHLYELTDDQNAKERYENTRRGVRIATSVGGTVTGEGGDVLLIDDPHSADEAVSSDAARLSVISWWQHTWSSRTNDPRTAAKVVVGQRVHERDLSGHLLDVGGFEHLCLPAEYEGGKHATSIGWRDPRTEHGALLWPERFGREEVDDLKRSLGSQAASGQLQQRPAPAGGALFKRLWWRYWQPLGANLPPVPVRDAEGNLRNVAAVEIDTGALDVQAQSWDCAFKDLASSDFVVGQVWGARRADRFLLDQVRARMDFPRTLNEVRRMREKWPRAGAIYVEDKANGSAVIATLKHEISGLIPVNPEGGKIVRAQAVSPQVEAGNVYLPHPSVFPWVDALLAELDMFPAGAHDDQVDALTQALVKMAHVQRSRLKVLGADDGFNDRQAALRCNVPFDWWHRSN